MSRALRRNRSLIRLPQPAHSFAAVLLCPPVFGADDIGSEAWRWCRELEVTEGRPILPFVIAKLLEPVSVNKKKTMALNDLFLIDLSSFCNSELKLENTSSNILFLVRRNNKT